MSAGIDGGDGDTATVWAAFGDLMAVMLGVFVLILLGVVGAHLHTAAKLEHVEREQARLAEQRETLERALAAPLAAGRVTLVDGRIGIRGSLLFPVNSDALQDEGRALLRELAAPLSGYLSAREEILMVSGFTDDRPVLQGNRRYADNWDLSAQRALTVTRALVEEGVPADSVFAAAFGDQHPVDSNDHEAGRARNRRVEIAPVPRPRQPQATADGR